ncbi:class I glutamine amidotransferase-like protein [Podospora conica]|nr:class I glutamine amidotransferase-like protein [Schizothecium conicum]
MKAGEEAGVSQHHQKHCRAPRWCQLPLQSHTRRVQSQPDTTPSSTTPSSFNMSPPGTTPAPRPPLKIAILLNSYRSPFIAEIRDSYLRALAAVDPSCTPSFFYPADKPTHLFPDPSAFDLIVIGGGNADPRKRHAWILAVHAFILDVVARQQQQGHAPVAKLCGICWGHQTISMLFGGEVGDMDVPELGVTESKLTPLGQRFFHHHYTRLGHGGGGAGTVRLQQHHRREVRSPPKGFHELIAGRQAFLSHSNAILTFQGHPEKDARTAKLRVRDAARWYGMDVGDARAMGELVGRMEVEHDGLEVWRGILRWVGEGTGGGGRL